MKHAVALLVLTGFAVTAGCAWQTDSFTATELPSCKTPFILTGRIIELASDYPVAGAQILVLGLDMQVRADAAGYFRLCGLPTGQHQLRVSGSGFETYMSAFIVIDSVNINLEPIKLKSHASLTDKILQTLISRW